MSAGKVSMYGTLQKKVEIYKEVADSSEVLWSSGENPVNNSEHIVYVEEGDILNVKLYAKQDHLFDDDERSPWLINTWIPPKPLFSGLISSDGVANYTKRGICVKKTLTSLGTKFSRYYFSNTDGDKVTFNCITNEDEVFSTENGSIQQYVLNDFAEKPRLAPFKLKSLDSPIISHKFRIRDITIPTLVNAKGYNGENLNLTIKYKKKPSLNIIEDGNGFRLGNHGLLASGDDSPVNYEWHFPGNVIKTTTEPYVDYASDDDNYSFYVLVKMSSGNDILYEKTFTRAVEEINTPTNFRAVRNGDTVTFNWDSVPNAVSYKVYLSPTLFEGDSVVLSDDATDYDVIGTSLELTLDENITYYAVIKAYRGERFSQTSDFIEIGRSNMAPTSVITSDTDLGNLTEGMSISLKGDTSSDLEGPIAAYHWLEEEETLGVGSILTLNNLTAGIRNISLIVADSQGLTNRQNVVLNIKETHLDLSVTSQEPNTYRTFSDGVTDIQEVTQYQDRKGDFIFIGTSNGKIIILDAKTLEEKSKIVVENELFRYVDSTVDHIYLKGNDMYVSLNVRPSALDGHDSDIYMAHYTFADGEITHFNDLFKLRSDPTDRISNGAPVTGAHIEGEYLYVTMGGNLGMYNISTSPVKEISFNWVYGGVKGLCGFGDSFFVYNSGKIIKYRAGSDAPEQIAEVASPNSDIIVCNEDLVISGGNVYDEDLNPKYQSDILAEGYWFTHESSMYNVDYRYSADAQQCEVVYNTFNINSLSFVEEIYSLQSANNINKCKEYQRGLIGMLMFDGTHVTDLYSQNDQYYSYDKELNPTHKYLMNGYIHSLVNDDELYIGTSRKILEILPDNQYKTVLDSSSSNFFGATIMGFDRQNGKLVLTIDALDEDSEDMILYGYDGNSLNQIAAMHSPYVGHNVKICGDKIAFSGTAYDIVSAFPVTRLYDNLLTRLPTKHYFGSGRFTCIGSDIYEFPSSFRYGISQTQVGKIYFDEEGEYWSSKSLFLKDGSFVPVYVNDRVISFTYSRGASKPEEVFNFVITPSIDDEPRLLVNGTDLPIYKEDNKYVIHDKLDNRVKEIESSCEVRTDIEAIALTDQSVWLLDTEKGVCSISIN